MTIEAVTIEAVADRMAGLLAARPLTFYELLRELPDVEYRAILQAWGALRDRRALSRDPHGRYLLRTYLEGQTPPPIA